MDKLPVLDFVPSKSKEPVLLKPPEKLRWTFSLRFWRQIDFFGLDKSQPKWFVSLLDKLKDLSDKEIENFISDAAEQNNWRYHPINWNQKNIPIQRKDLDWLDTCYRENPEDYPILQFQISKSLGRVVGFWDEKNVFNIVLLDPLHNIQPSQSHSYKVDPCSPLSCNYSSLLYDIDALKNQDLCVEKCGYKDKLKDFPSSSNYTNVVMHFLDDTQKAELDSVIDNGYSHTEIMLLGIELAKDNNS
ncbi:hypothetical protein [uncultured Amphritea sp.]|uniref:hypothetical protein n=1 Tax=uncultured Amphritea sp. TaxID=981605 RepID=UPI0026076DD0|nr:hypothetical protein [uncultured Amphritea sp.]